MANLPDEDPDERIAWLGERSWRRTACASARSSRSRAGAVRRRHAAVRASSREEARAALQGARPACRSSTAPPPTARFLRPRGIICYGVSPYPVDFFQSHLHPSRERADPARLLHGRRRATCATSSQAWATRRLTIFVTAAVNIMSPSRRRVASLSSLKTQDRTDRTARGISIAIEALCKGGSE